jgi:periplasmic divalent cation tolerance protein
MTDMIVVYVTCPSPEEAERIGTTLLEKRLCACINIYPEIRSKYYWPPNENVFEEAKETVLLIKSTRSKYKQLEKEICKIHSSTTPCIFAYPVVAGLPSYLDWIVGETTIKPASKP